MNSSKYTVVRNRLIAPLRVALGIASIGIPSIANAHLQGEDITKLVRSSNDGEIEVNAQERFNTGWNRHNKKTDFLVDANIFDVELMVKNNAFIGYLGGQTTDPRRLESSALSNTLAMGAGYRIFNDDRLRVDLAALLTQNRGTDLGYRLRMTGNEIAYTYSVDFRHSRDGFGLNAEGKYHIKGQTFVEGFIGLMNDTFNAGAGGGYAFFDDIGTLRLSTGPFYRASQGHTFGLWISVSATTPGSYTRLSRSNFYEKRS